MGGVLLALTVLAALVSWIWTPFDPELVQIDSRFHSLGEEGHWLGTDQLGRDILSQLMVGARTTLVVGLVAVGVSVLLGVPMGAVSALRRGGWEQFVLALSDIMFAFPAVLLALLLVTAWGRTPTVAMAAIGLAYAPVVARVARSAALPIYEQDFIRAARSYGRGELYILWRHVLPNIVSVLVIQITVLFALAVLAEAALSYLGIGTQPPTPSWGRSLQEAQTYLAQQPTLALWPGLAIAGAVLGFNLLGDGLRDRWDPRLVLPTEGSAWLEIRGSDKG